MNKPKDIRTQMILRTTILILLISAIVLVAGGFLDSETDESSNSIVEDNSDEATIPDFSFAPSEVVLPEMFDKAKEWSGDAQIHDVTATTLYFENSSEKAYFGTERGEFSSWLMSVYSPRLKTLTTVLWKNGTISISEESPVEDVLVNTYNGKSNYNNIQQLVSSNSIYQKAVENGLDSEESFYYMYLGGYDVQEKYPSQYVWMIWERSKTDGNGTEGAEEIARYFIDGKTGELLIKE